jgi:hypothetical protein
VRGTVLEIDLDGALPPLSAAVRCRLSRDQWVTAVVHAHIGGGTVRAIALVAFDFDERDEGVKEMIRLAVEGARRNNCHSGLCGQAPSDYPEMAEYLVRLGIDSMSLNPDTVIKTTQHVLEVEKRL